MPCGPRWYASIIEAAWTPGTGCTEEDGRLPPVPGNLSALLWPFDCDEAAPWLSELGWTICPPHSAPQAGAPVLAPLCCECESDPFISMPTVHADIIASNPCSDDTMWARQPGRGRFHHIAWKPDRCAHPTTEIMRGAFHDGYEEWNETALEPMCESCCGVFDSEVLHRGAASGDGWSATLTAQLVSTSGWPALRRGGRCDAKLLHYTIPSECIQLSI